MKKEGKVKRRLSRKFMFVINDFSKEKVLFGLPERLTKIRHFTRDILWNESEDEQLAFAIFCGCLLGHRAKRLPNNWSVSWFWFPKTWTIWLLIMYRKPELWLFQETYLKLYVKMRNVNCLHTCLYYELREAFDADSTYKTWNHSALRILKFQWQ